MRQLYPNLTEEEAHKQFLKKQLIKATDEITIGFLKLAALLKNSSFQEEQEWRLILPLSANQVAQNHPRLFRAGTNTLIPYIEMPLPPSEIAPFPLSDVILGPGSELSTSIDAARDFLVSEGLTISPRESRIPFRPW